LNSLLKRTDFADSFDALQLHAFYRALIPCIDTYASIKHYFYFWSSEKSIKQHLDTVNRFAETVIADRRKELESEQAGEERGDLLSRFMKAKNVRGEAPNDVELRDTILNFLIAGRVKHKSNLLFIVLVLTFL
jgi:cytochrome P450